MSAVFWLNNTDECSKKANTGQRVRWKKPVIIAFTTKLRQETNAAQATLLYKLKPLNLLHVFRINVSPGMAWHFIWRNGVDGPISYQT